MHNPEKIPGYPGWIQFACGCCAGIMWGGDHPQECNHCWGSGFIALHKKSGVLALYPGGPLLGRLSREEIEERFGSVNR